MGIVNPWPSSAWCALFTYSLQTQHPRQQPNSGVPDTNCTSYGKNFLPMGAVTPPSFATLVLVQNCVYVRICCGLLFSCSALCIPPVASNGIPSDPELYASSLQHRDHTFWPQPSVGMPCPRCSN